MRGPGSRPPWRRSWASCWSTRSSAGRWWATWAGRPGCRSSPRRCARAFYEPIEKLLAEGVADGSLRHVADPGAVALGVFGAITVAGLSASVEGRFADPSADAARFSAAISELILDGLATPRTRNGRELGERS